MKIQEKKKSDRVNKKKNKTHLHITISSCNVTNIGFVVQDSD